jgi:hypothetical protein
MQVDARDSLGALLFHSITNMDLFLSVPFNMHLKLYAKEHKNGSRIGRGLGLLEL